MSNRIPGNRPLVPFTQLVGGYEQSGWYEDWELTHRRVTFSKPDVRASGAINVWHWLIGEEIVAEAIAGVKGGWFLRMKNVRKP